MRRVQAVVEGVIAWAVAEPTVMVAAVSGTIVKQLLLVHSGRIVLVYMTCTAMSGSGSRTAITIVTVAPQVMVQRGCQARVVSVFCAAAPGTVIRTSCVRPTATGTPPLIATSILAFVSSRTDYSFYFVLFPFAVIGEAKHFPPSGRVREGKREALEFLARENLPWGMEGI